MDKPTQEQTKFDEALDQIIGFGEHSGKTKAAIKQIMSELGYSRIPELKVLGDEEIERQIKYAFDNNPYMPVEVMLKFIVQSSCQAQRDYDIQQLEGE